MKKNFSKYFLALISTLVLLQSEVTACGGYEMPTPEQTNYFFFDTRNMGTRNNSYSYESSDLNPINTQEWYAHFNKVVSENDLNYLVYNAKIKTIDSLIFFLKDGKSPLSEKLKSSSILKVKDKKNAKQFLYYLGYAKRCQNYSMSDGGWYYDEDYKRAQKEDKDINELIEGGRKLLQNIQYPFIKERYWFQLVRLYFQGGRYMECDSLFKAIAKDFKWSKSIKYRSMGYAAAALYRMGNYSAANYYYSKMFFEFPPMQPVAVWSFHPMEQSDWEATLAMAKNTKEKIAFWYLMAEDTEASLTEIYKLNPQSEYMNSLLGELMDFANGMYTPNKKHMYYYDYNYDDKEIVSDLNFQIDSTLLIVVKKIADEGKVIHRENWEMGYAYLMVLSNNYTEAELYLSKAKKHAKNNANTLNQIYALGIANKINQFKTIGAKEEVQIAKMFKDFVDRSESRVYYQWAYKYLSEKYCAQQDTIKAMVFDVDVNKELYNDDALVQRMIAYLKKENKSDFDQFAFQACTYSVASLYDRLGVHYMLAGKIEESYASFQNYEKEKGNTEIYYDQFYGDPFLIHIYDCHSCDHSAEKEIVYNKVSFAKKMSELNEKIKSDPSHAAQYHFELANGFYNITHFGNGRSFYENSINYPQGVRGFGKASVSDCSIAEAHYMEAYKLSADREFQAKCIFMAAKCAQNTYYVTNERPKYKYDNEEYFGILNDSYSDTKYYAEIVEECGYFQ